MRVQEQEIMHEEPSGELAEVISQFWQSASRQLDALKQMVRQQLEHDVLEEMVAVLAGAKDIHIVASGEWTYLARFMKAKLMELGKRVHRIYDEQRALCLRQHVQQADVVVHFMKPGYEKTLPIVQLVQGQGITVLYPSTCLIEQRVSSRTFRQDASIYLRKHDAYKEVIELLLHAVECRLGGVH